VIFIVGVNLLAQEKVRRKRIDNDVRFFYRVKDKLYKYDDRRVRLTIKSPSDAINITFVILC